MAVLKKIKFHYAAFNAVRQSPQVRSEIIRRANRIAAAAGPGFVVRHGANPGRSWARVYTGDEEARRAEAEGRALTRAINAGAG